MPRDAADNTLSYSDLPPGSRIVVEREDGVLRITFPSPTFTVALRRSLVQLIVIGAFPAIAPPFMLYYAHRLVQRSGSGLPAWILVGVPAFGVVLLLGLWVVAAFISTRCSDMVELTADKLTITRRIGPVPMRTRLKRGSITGIEARLSLVRVVTDKWWVGGGLPVGTRVEAQWLVRMLRQELKVGLEDLHVPGPSPPPL